MAFKLPDPIAKDFDLPELGGSVHIEGVVTREDRKDVDEEISALREVLSKKALTVRHPVTNKAYVPDMGDVVAASWVARCVSEPKMTPLQWLQFSCEGFKFLPVLFNECLICSREAPGEGEGDAAVPDGVDAAQEQLESGDPFEPAVAA